MLVVQLGDALEGGGFKVELQHVPQPFVTVVLLLSQPVLGGGAKQRHQRPYRRVLFGIGGFIGIAQGLTGVG